MMQVKNEKAAKNPMHKQARELASITPKEIPKA